MAPGPEHGHDRLAVLEQGRPAAPLCRVYGAVEAAAPGSSIRRRPAEARAGTDSAGDSPSRARRDAGPAASRAQGASGVPGRGRRASPGGYRQKAAIAAPADGEGTPASWLVVLLMRVRGQGAWSAGGRRPRGEEAGSAAGLAGITAKPVAEYLPVLEGRDASVPSGARTPGQWRPPAEVSP